ncbi:MAG: hypothetical protein RLZZ598_64 [Pseudomonadota bacterium]|jgi:crotonobetainyl-CoA:carnitine CoA-transferase CaiB-like acyl-CoA transferase
MLSSASSSPGPGALDGIRVLDLSRVLAGPWCTQTLGDLGADVLKIERPADAHHPGGDDTRGWGPPFLRDAEGRDTAESGYYLGANRNKRSLAIDLGTPAGQALIRELAGQADVLVENFKVGDMARHGLDHASLAALNPRLIYCSITGYGQTGPYRERAGYDYAIQGLGGLMSVTGERDERPGGGPQKVGVAVTDLFTGLYATIAILAALRHAEATGAGQQIDMALLDTQVAMLANLGANYLVSGQVPERVGNAHPNIVPYQSFEVADGHLILAIGNDSQFARFCEVAGHPELAGDVRFATNPQRVRHREQLVPILAGWLRARPLADWLHVLEAAKVPCGPINRLDQVFSDPQVQARGMVETLAHPHQAALRLVASPMKLSTTPPRTRFAPPRLAEHGTAALTEWLGWDSHRIAQALSEGAFGAMPRG